MIKCDQCAWPADLKCVWGKDPVQESNLCMLHVVRLWDTCRERVNAGTLSWRVEDIECE